MADTSMGIPAGLTGRVFEEFYQVPGVRRGGTGIADRVVAAEDGGQALAMAKDNLVDLVLADMREPS